MNAMIELKLPEKLIHDSSLLELHYSGSMPFVTYRLKERSYLTDIGKSENLKVLQGEYISVETKA